MDRAALDAQKDELRQLIAERLNVRAGSFERAVSRAGRLLPASARAAARQIADVETRLDHPKLAARTDPALIERAAETIRTSLSHHRPGVRAARDRSFLMAEIGFKLALLIGLGLAFLHWQTGT